MLFAVYTELLPGEDRTAVTAQAETSQHEIVPLTVEYVGKNPTWVWLMQINVKLADQLSGAGDVLVSFTVHGATSNKVQVTIQ